MLELEGKIMNNIQKFNFDVYDEKGFPWNVPISVVVNSIDASHIQLTFYLKSMNNYLMTVMYEHKTYRTIDDIEPELDTDKILTTFISIFEEKLNTENKNA